MQCRFDLSSLSSGRRWLSVEPKGLARPDRIWTCPRHTGRNGTPHPVPSFAEDFITLCRDQLSRTPYLGLPVSMSFNSLCTYFLSVLEEARIILSVCPNTPPKHLHQVTRWSRSATMFNDPFLLFITLPLELLSKHGLFLLFLSGPEHQPVQLPVQLVLQSANYITS